MTAGSEPKVGHHIIYLICPPHPGSRYPRPTTISKPCSRPTLPYVQILVVVQGDLGWSFLIVPAFFSPFGPFGGQIRNPREKLRILDPKSSKSELSGPISWPFSDPSYNGKSHFYHSSHDRKMATTWVHTTPISMIFGQGCVVIYEDSESGLQMAPMA